MPEWIQLDRLKLNAERPEIIGGVEVNVTLSPHDVPTAVRGSREPGGFLIEFTYLDEEPWRVAQLDDGLRVRLGRSSGRLYGIMVPDGLLPKNAPCQLSVSLPPIIDRAEHTLSRLRKPWWRRLILNSDNFQVAKEAILGASERLTPSICGNQL